MDKDLLANDGPLPPVEGRGSPSKPPHHRGLFRIMMEIPQMEVYVSVLNVGTMFLPIQGIFWLLFIVASGVLPMIFWYTIVICEYYYRNANR